MSEWPSSDPDTDPSHLACIQLAHKIVNARAACKALDDQLTNAKQKRDALELELVQLMDANELKKFTVKGIGTIYQTVRLFPSVDDLEKAKVFFATRGVLAELLKETVDKGRLTELLGELRDAGEAMPDGLSCFEKVVIHIRKE